MSLAPLDSKNSSLPLSKQRKLTAYHSDSPPRKVSILSFISSVNLFPGLIGFFLQRDNIFAIL